METSNHQGLHALRESLSPFGVPKKEKRFRVQLTELQIWQVIAAFDFAERVRFLLSQKWGIFTIYPAGGMKHKRIKENFAGVGRGTEKMKNPAEAGFFLPT